MPNEYDLIQKSSAVRATLNLRERENLKSIMGL